MSQPYLDVREGDVTRRFMVKADKTFIGRNHDCAIVLTDTLASRVHCVIERSPTGWYLKDLRSRNGTSVNGAPTEGSLLKTGDVIGVGAARITFLDPMAESVGGTYSMGAGLGRTKPPARPTKPADDVEVLSAEDLVVEDAGLGFDLIDAEEPVASAGPAASTGTSPSARNAAASLEQLKTTDPEKALELMASSLPDQGVREGDIALVNSRGQVMHGARAQALKPGQRREPIDLMRLMLLVCLRSRTTDIHLEPRQENYGVRFRVDGLMVDVAKVESQLGVRLATLVKVLSDIDIAQRNALQEGHFSARVPSGRSSDGFRRIDYRVSFAPSVFGQKLVIRILDAENAPLKLGDLKLPGWMDRDLSRFIETDSGMVIVSGPTGSGKTTTLYSLLRSIDINQRNAVTIEDPVEMQLEGTTQMPVDEAGGKSFLTILRSVLRQDPDVIMVGEIRDGETARTAMQAAITGHMVLSSIHTRDTLGTVYRLLDLGVEPYLVSQALNVVVAQRLVRQLCPTCRQKVTATPEQRKAMASAGIDAPHVFVPGGCARCLGTGHSGRRGVFELLTVSDELRTKMQNNATLEDLRDSLKGTEFVSLQQMGFALVAKGEVAFDEIDKLADRSAARR